MKLSRFTEFINYTIPNFQRDAVIPISGDRSSGKTNTALRIALKSARDRGIKFSLKDDIYYTSIEGLSAELMTQWRLIRIIDEGYFGMFNLDVNARPAKELSQTLNAVRNRGHIVIICLSKLTRGIKPLLEISNYWIHKPTKEWGILYCRDREFVGDDPWAVEDLLKAKTVSKKRWLLRHNPNYIMTMQTKKVKARYFEEYDKYKREAQEELGQASQLTEEYKKHKMVIMAKMNEAYTNGDFDMLNIRSWLQSELHIPSMYLERYIKDFKEYRIADDAYNRVQQENQSTLSAPMV